MESKGKPTASALAIWAGMASIYIVWGSTYLAIRFAIETIPPFLMAGLRFLIAGSLLYAWRRLSGDAAPTRLQWRSAAMIGLFLLVGGNGGVSWAEQRVASSVAALLVASVPLWMIVLDLLRQWKKDQPGVVYRRPGWLAVVGVLVGFSGVILLVGPGQMTGLKGDIDLLGAAVLVLSASLWAAGSLYSRGADLPASPLLGTAMEMLCGGAGLLLLGTLSGGWSHFDLAAISGRSWAGFAYLVVFGSLVGFGAYTWLLRVAPTTLVSTYAYVNPVIAVLAGSLLEKEVVTPRILVAAAIIIGSVVLITRTSPPAPSPKDGEGSVSYPP